ncbi:hypothetical protein [Selenomonas bovis]|uniref:hypothetical protein n=1 Tax=Selenomonas bovis TaxID=416586 RepID=UPI0003761767|nr:hypothetical protein [Selenomonas bovis]
MPMEAGAVGVRPALRPQAQNNVDDVARKDSDGAADGFRPQTNVAIKNAIDDMAGVLSKIAANENKAMAEMPQDLQRVLQNVLKNAFSFNRTLSEGLGSTMESQRFSMEQLTSVARTLTQMATLAEKGYDVQFSDGLQTLLTNLKGAITSTEHGQDLEPVLILKESFELLNGKEAADLPQALQQMIAQLQEVRTPATPNSNLLKGLHQLIRYFMPQGKLPQPSETTGQQMSPGSTGKQTSPNTCAPAGSVISQKFTADLGQEEAMTQAKSATKGFTANAAQETTPPQATVSNATLQTKTIPKIEQGSIIGKGQTSSVQQTETKSVVDANRPLQKNDFLLTEKQNMKHTTSTEENLASTPQKESAQSARFPSQDPLLNGLKMSQHFAERQQTTKNVSSNNLPKNNPEQIIEKNTRETADRQITAREAREFLMKQPFENSPQLISSLKTAVSRLLRQGNLSLTEAQSLQRFVKEQGQVFSPKEARQIETLLRLCQQNIPATVQQAAIQQNLPGLPRLWAFMQLCDLAVAKRLNARQLKKAGHEIADFATSMRSSMEGDHAIQPGQRSMNFMMPLYLGENEQSYPAYIHVYDETQEDKETGVLKKETWLRLCVLTDHLGAVELTCRVYDREHLDIRLFFAGNDTAQQFRSFVPELRRKLRNSKLHLEDIAIDAAND